MRRDLSLRFPGAQAAVGEILAAGLLVLAILLFFYEMIFHSQVPLFRDLGPFFYPMRFSLAQAFQQGELPLWEPRVGMGFPLLANFQSGAFYPPNLMYLVLPFVTAIKAAFLLHFCLGAIGAYSLLRHWGFVRSLALVGSLLFTLSGLVVSLTNLLNHLQAAIWLPWLLLVGERQLICRHSSSMVVFALMATVQFLAGSPEFYAMSMALVFLNGLRLRGEGQTSLKRLGASLLLVNGLVAGLAMVQILPTWELVRESPRYQAPSFRSVSEFSLEPGSLANLFFLDKEVDVTSHYRFQTFFTNRSRFFMSLYMGVLFPFGLWAWLLSEERMAKAALLGGVAASLLLALGDHTSLHRLFYEYFPLAFLGRFPEKWFFVTFVLLLYAALRGCAALLIRRPGQAAGKTLIGPAILFGVFLALYLFFQIFRESLWKLIGFFKGISPDLVLTREISSGVLFQLERQAALLFSLGLLLILWQRQKIRSALGSALLVVITFLDLSSAHRPYLFLTDENILRQRPAGLGLLKDLPSHRIFFISPQSPIHPIIALFPGAKIPEHQSTFSFLALRPNTGVLWGVPYLQDMDALMRASYDEFRAVAGSLPADRLYSLLGNLNVKYVAALQELPAAGIHLVGHFAELPLWLYRIQKVVPQAYLAQGAVHESEPVNVISRLADGRFNPYREVILEEPVELPAGADFVGEVKVVSYAATSVSVRASLNQPAILVLTDSSYPGWKVYVDGAEEKILRVNYFFRGVLLPPGHHHATFQYEPASFRYGLAFSLATAVLLGAFFFWDLLRRRRGRYLVNL